MPVLAVARGILALFVLQPQASPAPAGTSVHAEHAGHAVSNPRPAAPEAPLDEFQSPLQRAFFHARRGDTVIVPAGIHRGRFLIDKSITVRGEPGAVLDGEGRGTVVTVTADSVTLAALRVTGSGLSLDDDQSSVRIEGCRGCVVDGLLIDRPLHGIYLANVVGARISNNVIMGDSLMAEARRGNGIHLYNSVSVRISRNVIRSTRDGIYFSFASSNFVDSNTVTGLRYGLHYMYSNDNRFEGNRFRMNAAGGAIMFSDRIVLRGNHFSDHAGQRAYGLLLQTTTDVLAEGNYFRNNVIGLFIDNSTRTLFRRNTVEGNGIGVDLLPSSRLNTLVENSFVHNRTQVRIARGGGATTWAQAGRGNFWGERSVYDLDRDGIGDRPLKIGDAFATLAQARPALELFAHTPAARILSWAEEAIPAFTVLRVEDPAPLTEGVSALAQRVGGTISLSWTTGVTLLVTLAIGVQLGRMQRTPDRARSIGLRTTRT